MPIFWSIILATGLGGICGAWMPILPFICILVLSCIGVVASSYFSSPQFIPALLSGLCVGTILQTSYIAGMFFSKFLGKIFNEKKVTSHKVEQNLNTDTPPNT